ncbi:MAG: hypothetical protein M3Y27_15440 [Acidobacteriota bacterium]|nr:hypothetical protein [Acidobacteriota bacterium]
MAFDPAAYGQTISDILALDQNGARLMPLVSGTTCSSLVAHAQLSGKKAADLFPGAQAPEAALAGLWLYFSCFDESHQIAQDVHTHEGSLWHAILHRQEPDSGNSAYWFRKAGHHPIFEDLWKAADGILARFPEAEFRTGGTWDTYAFIMFCERARQQPGSPSERAALEIQREEWQLLFDHCARHR